MNNYSPLRYPGGKSVIYPIIANAIKQNELDNCIYIEPFAGGASIALKLLIDGVVDQIVINDADKAVYSFWKTVVEYPVWFVERIKSTPITVDEWRYQRAIFCKSNRYSKEFGFATFFLNRTNRSGILSAGPIGGYSQSGNYMIDCRFNKDILIEKINRISLYRKNIKVYNQDIVVLLNRFLPVLSNQRDLFIYFDPPYYEKGQRLYLNHFSDVDHKRLRNIISQMQCKWIMTYDDKQEISELYSHFISCKFSINYSLSNKKKGNELMFFKDSTCIPPPDVIKSLSKSIFFESAKGMV